MARFKKDNSGKKAEMNTSSMSDIIFTLLFFFMIVSNMRETSLFVKITLPQASEIQKLEKKNLVSTINIGFPIDKKYGTEHRIQLNDQFAEPSDIGEFIEKEKLDRMEHERSLLTNLLKVDKDVKMGIVSDVKQELRKANSFKISYIGINTKQQ